MSDNLYRCFPRQTYDYIIQCLEAGLVPFVRSSPGIGKSSLFRKAARQWNLKMIDHRVSTAAPEDFTGLPEFYTREYDGQRLARFSPFGDLFPIEGTQLPEGKDGWLLFLDEFNSGTKMVQAASYKLLLDRMTGQANLHPNVAIGLAGNLDTDRAIVTNLSTATQSRVIHIEMQVNHRQWLEDVALPQNYDSRIKAYLSFKEGDLLDFKPDHQEKTFCCPRTWEFMNKLIKGKEVNDDRTALFAGTITSGVATNFVAFCKLQASLVTIKDVLADPNGAPVPEGADKKWIVTTHLAEQVDAKTLGDVATYIARFDLAFKIQFWRSLMILKPAEVRPHPAFATAMQTLSKYLKD